MILFSLKVARKIRRRDDVENFLAFDGITLKSHIWLPVDLNYYFSNTILFHITEKSVERRKKRIKYKHKDTMSRFSLLLYDKLAYLYRKSCISPFKRIVEKLITSCNNSNKINHVNIV